MELIKKKTFLEKKVPLSINSNSKIPSFIYPTISNHKNISSKKPTYFNESSNIEGRVSIASSHAKDQYHQFISIDSKDYSASKLFLSKSLLHDLNLLYKSIYCKMNEETKKITRACNTHSFSNYKPLPISKETIRLNDTNSLSNKLTIIS